MCKIHFILLRIFNLHPENTPKYLPHLLVFKQTSAIVGLLLIKWFKKLVTIFRKNIIYAYAELKSQSPISSI